MGLFHWLKARHATDDDRFAAARRDVLAAQLELFRLARAKGRKALLAHARADASPIFAKYRHISGLPFACRLLHETTKFLSDETRTTAELEVMIDAWLSIELARSRLSKGERQIVRCIRSAMLAFHGGAHPLAAMRIGRTALESPTQLPTVELTALVKEMSTL